MNRPLRTLFYGLTHEHAPGKFDTLLKMKDAFEIVAIADDRPRGSFVYLDRQIDPGDIPVISEKDALKLPNIDVVIIEVTNCNLMDVAGKFVERGIPMHCDKPCGESLEPYRSLVRSCSERNLPFQIGYMYRGNPAVRFAWNMVQKGLLGDIAFIEADMNHDYSLSNYPDYIATFRGGILYNLGCHLVDMVYPLVNGRSLDSAIPILSAAPSDPAGSGTHGASLLRFGGTTALIRMCAHMAGGMACRRLRVDGTNGTLEIRPIERFDGQELTLELTLKNSFGGYAAGFQIVGFGVQTDRYQGQLADLAAIVRGERPNDQDYDRDLAVHEITLKACGLL